MRMPGSLGLKMAAVFCACLLSTVSYAKEAEATASPSQEAPIVASALPDAPEPQNSNSRTQQQQPTALSQQQGTAQPPPGAPSLGDLGFPTEQTKPNPQQQALLDKRSHMLKVHQRLGLITAIPLVATVVTGSMAGGHSTSSSTRDLHAALGSTTAGLYIATALFDLRSQDQGNAHSWLYPMAQSTGFYSRAGNDSDPDSGRHGFPAEE